MGQAGPRFGALALLGVQALALLLLTLSLTAMELRRHRIEFHNPIILVLRDQSASFRNGEYLGLGRAYERFEKDLVENYQNQKFDVRLIDFHSRAWPVRGFTDITRFSALNPAESLGLTSFSAVTEFLDSVAMINLQAIFLFSDGRANLDSGKASHSWIAPVFPIVFKVDSIGEVQTQRVSLNHLSGSKTVEVNVAYQKVGSMGKEATLRLIQGGKTLLQRNLPLATGSENFRFAWSPDKPLSEESLPIKAIIQPSLHDYNFDPFNDTLPVTLLGGGNQKRLYILRPVHSLDEKGMLDILSASDSDQVVFFSAEELPGLKLSANDQIWVDSRALFESRRLMAVLQSVPAKIVVYVRPEFEGGNRLSSPLPGAWKKFSPAAQIKVSRAAADEFPDDVVRLRGLTQSSLEAPEVGSSVTSLVEIVEGDKRGLLLGRMNLAGRKGVLFFVLPMIWSELFDPQADFSIRANITGYFQAIKAISDLEDGTIQVTVPKRAFHLVPFNMHFRIPESVVINARMVSQVALDSSRSIPLSLSISGVGYTQKLGLATRENLHEPEWKGIVLSQGRYKVRLSLGDSSLWSDSLEVAPILALELARIGFDEVSLSEMALRSAGRVLVENANNQLGSADSVPVSSRLPKLPPTQVRMEKAQNFRLYNNRPLFFTIFGLLALSWFLRKKWDFD
jgi:hypothetical protein